MKTCLACGNTQDEGKFCGSCGTLIENPTVNPAFTENNQDIQQGPPQLQKQQQQQQQQQYAQTTQQNSEQIEKIKQQSKMYFNYYLEQLKRPSANFNMEATWKNGLISIILYVVLIALSMYLFINTFMGGGYSYFDSYGPSFIQVFFYISLFILLLIAISVFSIFITSKLFSQDLSLTNIIGKIGGYYALPIATTVLGILLTLLKSYTLSMIVIYIGFAIIIGIVPMFVMIKLLNNKTKAIDSFYAFMIYIIITAILTAIIFAFIVDSTIGDYLDYFI